jgi:hypothetical protein
VLKQTCASSDNQESRLLGLPTELRNQIYDFVLGGLRLRLQIYGCIIESPPINGELEHLQDLRPLNTVCRQLYAETRLLPFIRNLFTGVVGNFRQALDGKPISGEQLSAMRKLEIIMNIRGFDRKPILGTKRKMVALGMHVVEMFRNLRKMRDVRQVVLVWNESCRRHRSMWTTMSPVMKSFLAEVLRLVSSSSS